MTTFKRTRTGVLALLAGVACLSTSVRAADPIVMVIAPAAPALAFYYANANGLFAKAGLDITVLPATSGSATQVAVVGGAAQLGFTNTLTLTNAVAKGIGLMAIAPGSLYEKSHPTAALMVMPDSPIKRIADLDGKTVAVTGLSDMLAIGTKGTIDQNGGISANVKFVELPPGSMYAALEAHRVDAIAAYDPYASSFAAQGARTIGHPFDGIGPAYVQACYFARTDWLQSHRDAANRFAQVIHDASLYSTAHFRELIPFIAEFSKLPVATLETMQPQSYPGGMYPAHLQPVIDAAAKYEHLTPFPASHEIYDAPVNSLSAQ